MTTEPLAPLTPDWRLCVAPMIDVTDRHCRYFHRLLAPHARLYTEMITTGALLHGKVARHLDFDPAEEPVALQLGGSEPEALAEAARLGEQWGYNEINLNCGCPSERVQRGSFGACLMAEPELVADGMKAMQDAVSIPVTVKHRLGLDYNDSYDFVRDFVGKIYDTGCRVFVVHARNAVLKGLSPKDNREKPPLRYDAAARLKADFPDCTIVLNGGITDTSQATELMQQFDGVMLGRAAWHNPGVLSDITRAWHPAMTLLEPAQVVQAMVQYAGAEIEKGVPLRLIVRSMLGWMSGRQGARHWRRTLSDHSQLNINDPRLIERAWSDLVLRTSEAGYELAASESDGQSRI
ncbi:MAG TPA: tRNA dihydrouridine(20/20a) synthase DusA [Candidimonas sp.]|nr:tRNA dihydrouridine(20/20a) synthase DusA [Candidimonas sp.]